MNEWDFYMPIQDVFSITGRGTVVTGQIQQGQIRIGDTVTISRTNRSVTIAGIEQFRKVMDSAVTGDTVGVLLRDVDRSEVQQGDVLTKGGRASAYRDFYNPVEENARANEAMKPVKTGCLWAFLGRGYY